MDATSVYWTSWVRWDDARIMKVPIAGGAAVTLASGQQNPSALAVDDTNLYWATGSGGTVVKLPLAGGDPTLVASGQGAVGGLAIDATSIYWADYDNGALMKPSIAGDAPVALASGQASPGEHRRRRDAFVLGQPLHRRGNRESDRQGEAAVTEA